jgi:hypothetical protein
MKVMLAGAAVAVFMTAFGGVASASICSNQCNQDYSTCNSLNGGAAQQVCMPKWMQCKKACNAPAPAPPTKISTVKVKPKP